MRKTGFISSKIYLWIFLILLIAIIIRIWGIGFGLPYEYHPDEAQYVVQAVQMGQRGLEPTWWNNPPFYKYVLFCEYGGYYLLGKIAGVYQSTSDFGAQFKLDPTYLFLLGRFTTALLGTFTVLAIYFFGKELLNRNLGFLSAFFLSVCFLHVRDSHFAVNDVPATLLVTLGLYFAVRIYRASQWRWYLLGGLVTGIGFATKYTSLIVLLPIFIAHILSPHFTRTNLQLMRLLGLISATIVSAIIASPYFILRGDKIFQDIYDLLILPGKIGFNGWEIDPNGGFLFYLKTLSWGVGWGLLILLLTGVVLILIQKPRQGIILSTFCLVYFIFMGSQQMYFARFILPIIPCLMVFSAYGLMKLTDRLKDFLHLPDYVLIGLAILVAVQPLLNSLRFDWLLTQQDTRTLAKAWIEENIPAGSKIAVDWLYFAPQLESPEETSPNSLRQYDLTIVSETGLTDHSVDWYLDQGFQYIISSSFFERTSLANPIAQEQRSDFYKLLEYQFKAVKTFKPCTNQDVPFIYDEVYGPAVSLWQRECTGPELRIYKLLNN